MDSRLLKYGLPVLIALFIALKILDIGGVSWDDSVYMGMGKYLFSGGNTGLWETIRPIGLPSLLGFFWALGADMIVVSKIISLLFSAGTIIAAYLLAKKIFNETAALLAALLLMMSPVFFSSSSAGLTEIPSVFFALLGIYFFAEEKNFAAGVLAGISFMFRFPMGLLLAALLASSYIKKKKIDRALLSGFFLAVLPFLIFNYMAYGNPITPFADAVLHQDNPAYSVISDSLVSHIYNLFYYAIWLIRQNLLLLFLIPGIYLVAKNRKADTVIICFALFIVYFTFIINKQPRFMLSFLPFACIIAAFGMVKLYPAMKKRVRHAGISLVLISLIPALLMPGEFGPNGQEGTSLEFYTYFRKHGTNLSILATTPIPIAYSDVKLVHFYNNVDEATEIYEKEKNNVGYIMYTSEFYPCPDDICRGKKQELFESISSQNELIYYKEGKQGYYIFRTYTPG
ncbi:TPA: phospholipid carrier-dependent glycosyltransferase [Candidatus Woesearchaeota archaeon]|nr:hypothetical protein QT06_C0001G0526 [archaeon GW2011_AR15]MBS3103837.1 glycosyltransferase family 39 protein [Candidatus Woesearchaeota archaeon]HIH40837.1 phospholipid carrier-dependent glycosyltransferase [Candidatus Woesearchaeota archaeon]